MIDPAVGPVRCAALRQELARRGLDGFIVPRADAHQGEYVPPSDARLQWLTGFAGSAGIAVVLADEAAIFVDGRYTIQVREQVDTDVFKPMHLVETPLPKWLREVLKPGTRIGFDPMLHTVNGAKRLQSACSDVGADLVALEDNPLDAVWEDRPKPPIGRVRVHPRALAGETVANKIAQVKGDVTKAKADAVILTQPDSIAWLFNIRGSDVQHTPLPLSFALVPNSGCPRIFIDARKLSGAARDHLGECAEIEEPDALLPALAALGGEGHAVLLDPDWTAVALAEAVTESGGRVVHGADPVILPKAIKNEAEIAGARAAHLRDGVAFCRFLAWFDRAASEGKLDEIAVAEQLESFRMKTGRLRDISFDTISAAGANAAIPHYRVDRQSNRLLPADSLFLIDSGGQYEDGTTDITRTIAVGTVNGEQRRHFTLVLKGHIAIATARFPMGTSGAQLDALARIALWRSGLDFDHGTGHGVGSYLSVHEGPQRISKAGHVALEPGMIVSNEPGYYRDGSHGIRIENLELVTAPEQVEGGERAMLGFEALTLAPIDRRCLSPEMLTSEEIAWLDTYHARVLTRIGPHLSGGDLAWLEAATRPVGR